MKEQNYCRELPAGYTQAYYLNCKKISVGLIFTVISLVVLVLVMALSAVPMLLGAQPGYALTFADSYVSIYTELSNCLQLISTSYFLLFRRCVHLQ